MKINTSSPTTQLYMWFYGITERKLPTNLCPYFWKLVLMISLIIPYSIFCIPVVIYEVILKILKKEDSRYETFERIGVSIFAYFSLIIVTSLIVAVSLFWNTYPLKTSPLLSNLSMLGVLIWLIGILIGLYHLIKFIYEWYIDRNVKYDENGYRLYSAPKDSIVKEFIKAKYYKYCPRIEWINNKK